MGGPLQAPRYGPGARAPANALQRATAPTPDATARSPPGAQRAGKQARMQEQNEQWSASAAAGGRACAGGRPTSSATRSTSGSVSSPPAPCPSGE